MTSLSANGKRCSRRPGRSSKWITKKRRLAVYLRDGMTCMYCGTDLHDAEPKEIGLDHVIPQVDCPDGKLPSGISLHHESNLVTACRTCNSGRKDTPVRQFAAPGAIVRIRRHTRRSLKRYLKLAAALLAGTAKEAA